jgi:hypothetical protein
MGFGKPENYMLLGAAPLCPGHAARRGILPSARVAESVLNWNGSGALLGGETCPTLILWGELSARELTYEEPPSRALRRGSGRAGV